MVPVTTTGFSDLTVRLSQYAVSSMEEVPWVTTMPEIPGSSWNRPLIFFVNSNQRAGPRLPLPAIQRCSAFTLAKSLTSGMRSRF